MNAQIRRYLPSHVCYRCYRTFFNQLLSYARYRDGQLGRTNSRLAHFYIAPAMLALAVLTFYPVMYGFWLSFTDADQTHLGEQAFMDYLISGM